MDRIRIQGGRPLKGTVKVSGAKNSALPIMAASLLTEDELVIRGVPNLRDVTSQCKVLECLGVHAHHDAKTGTLRLRSFNDDLVTAPWELVRTMRASVCVLGPLLAKRKRARVAQPGGCVFGVRPIDRHLYGLECLGASIHLRGGYVEAEAERLRGAMIYLGSNFGSTVLGTANVVMAAVLAEGETLLECAALEPEVEDLCKCLNAMGARIEGIGSHCLRIRGVDRLHGTEHTVIVDRVEAGTFLMAGMITGGDVTVRGADPRAMLAVLERLEYAGASVELGADFVRISGPERPRPMEVTTLAFPGFPTDLQAQIMAVLCLADGISMVNERIYPDRFIHVAELLRMGARIRKEGSSAVIQGVPKLSGAPVMASDLRGSAALVLAGLVAEGETEVHRVYHIDRGYEGMDVKLRHLGARLERLVTEAAHG